MPKRKNLPQITKEQFLARVMSCKPDREKVIRDLLRELHAYEMKYEMRSEFFYKLVVGTPLEDQPDFLDWAMCYREYLQAFQSQVMPERATADVTG
jgi:hypothetical protein